MARYIGLMSGTSLDGVDGVMAAFEAGAAPQVLAHVHVAMPSALAAELLALNRPAGDELHRAAAATRELMRVYGEVVDRLLRQVQAGPSSVRALGAHGQTVRHRPRAFSGGGYTLQLCDGALLAEWTGIDCICDFRSADVAAGGQGAPLVPAFHAACWADSGRDQAVLNVGGIANLTLLGADGQVGGFDTGPGNLLMDLWCQRAFGCAYDDNGSRAAGGRVIDVLLRSMLADPFFAAAAPKSTGRDDFNADWLDRHLTAVTHQAPAADVLATLAELTARSVAAALRSAQPRASRLMVCGGGAHNAHLLDRLRSLLPGVAVETTLQAAGLAADHIEALAFAWLASRRVEGLPGNRPEVTGACGPRVLGAWHRSPGRTG